MKLKQGVTLKKGVKLKQQASSDKKETPKSYPKSSRRYYGMMRNFNQKIPIIYFSSLVANEIYLG